MANQRIILYRNTNAPAIVLTFTGVDFTGYEVEIVITPAGKASTTFSTVGGDITVEDDTVTWQQAQDFVGTLPVGISTRADVYRILDDYREKLAAFDVQIGGVGDFFDPGTYTIEVPGIAGPKGEKGDKGDKGDTGDVTPEMQALVTEAETAAAQAALFEGPWLDDMAALAADTTLTYTPGSPSTVTEGQYVRTRSEGYSFAVAADDATDESIATPGLVKLYARGDSLDVRQFVVDDDTLLIDQSQALQKWYDECANLSLAPSIERATRAMSEDKLYYQPGADMPGCVDMRRLSLHFALDGGLHIGEPGQAIIRSDLYTPKITRRGTLTWLAEERASRLSDNAGLVLYNCIGSHIRVSSVIGFTIGYAAHAEDGFFAYNTLDVGWISDNRYAEVLRSMDAGGFINENAFNGGNRTCYSGANLLGDAYGTVITAADGAYRGHNTNRFNTPCYEMNSPASATYRVPVLLDRAGVYNYWILPRHEGGKGPFGIADNGSGASTNAGCFNKVLFGYEQSGAPGPTFYAGWKQVAGAYGNIAEHAINTPRPRFSSGPLARIAKSSGGNTPKIAAPYFMQTGTNPSTAVSPSRTGPSTGIRANSRCLNIVGGSNAVLIEVDTTKIKTWRLTGSFLDGKGGRPFIQAFGVPPAWNGGQTVLANTHRTNDGGKVYVCRTGGVTDAFGGPTGTGTNIADGAVVKWDYAGVLADFAQGAVLVGTVTDNWGTEQYVKSYLLPAVNAGGGYVAGSDTQTPVLFTVRDDVTKIRIGYVGGSNSCALLGFQLEGYPTLETNNGVYGAFQAVAILDPLPTQSGSGAVVSANPASSGIHGFYGDGDMLSIAGAASGQPMGCKASITGALAPARAPSTAYAVIGTLAVADTDKIYELTTPGTTDAGAGPTGTGKGIADGTAKWDYLCPKAAFTALPNMP